MWKEIYKKYLQLVQQSGDRRPFDEFYLKKRSRQNLDRPEGCSNRYQLFLLGNTPAIDGRILWWH
jgi:hypothetical protein